MAKSRSDRLEDAAGGSAVGAAEADRTTRSSGQRSSDGPPPVRARLSRAVLRRLLVAASFAAPVMVFAAVLVVLADIDRVPGSMWDVEVAYHQWAQQWYLHGRIMGVSAPWVYPVLAIAPMIAAGAWGAQHYADAWLVLVAVASMAAFVPLLVRSRRLAWWWAAFTACLGPIALARIDAVALPLVVLGVLLIARRPFIASLLLTAAVWVKVWPIAMLASAVASGTAPRRVLLGAASITTGLLAASLCLGAGTNVLSAASAQAGRGLQIEAPVALPWMWLALLRPGLANTYFDYQILAYQVTGRGTALAAAVMTPLLVLSAIVVLLLMVAARSARADPLLLTATSSLGLVSALIGLNKVGSPQYATWFVAPVLLGLLVDRRAFRFPAAAVLVLAVLTQDIFPWDYTNVIGTSPSALVVLTLRNGVELVLLLWSVGRLLGQVPATSRLSLVTERARGAWTRAVERMTRPADPGRGAEA